ncbi:hypothetical protein A3I27_03165 [Candidatus Giovannonibacteria bacterium RIFCSPLOWO2_02_FULL_43_11b]|uniref:General secretion pathway GspH domain-containing protein n=1 Tax=Candidatus Giovannonibacteria bacterium RIFCSPHIGHO2_12_FULL_43_15 TaxID=1798341 RepID=A0A1F5WP43_9BACT|nr:MAG: hypothetical protein A3B97_01625 [Candidatus Giovannonibacteria bacterium RIFCSPHIGHO2_02_FULL_43_32]OGF77433.1 MAG: hypothetical protein A3F23_01675 [Candidatus Giovannonibacteria bacterium RIFCSPHIGHO2_12_FULL_43_15]OGF89366.1 MAG: hypothetical protein A3I27_03165 [Candidatus Giovannonibacteria bacterium RIFCSPLOWO2_02_FULL_43_11b]OGF92143.1 MAG: hypothetical protein A3H04_00735 [Candidatus Giovannonibacteria bacterium RIFCSPLOWO2_12_FULL_43_11c]
MKNSRGFTLVEMLIVIIIISIVTTISLVGYKNYGARLNVRRSANEVALAIREAQANALAVKGYNHDNNSGTPLLFTSWGVYFNKTVSTTQFNIFVDSDGDKSYDSGESVKTVNIMNSIKIFDLAKGRKTSETDGSVDRLDIIYQRPNPDTTLKADGGTCSGAVISGTCPDLEIILQGPDGGQRTVVVWSTGQISVE